MNNSQDSFNHLMGLAQRSHQKGDMPMAINLYKEALKVIPKQADALQYLGIAYCTQENYEEGIKYLEKAIAIQPENPVLLTNLSNAYLKVNAYPQALPLLQKSVTIKPDFDEAWHKLGNTLKALNKIDEAIQAYQKAIELNPNHFNAYYNLGNTMMHLGNYKTAISFYEKSLVIKPDFALAHNNIGIALLEWDQIEEAEQHYIKAVQFNPSFKEAIKNLAQLYEKSGKEEQAKKCQEQLLKVDPSEKALQFHIDTKSHIIYNSTAEIDLYQQNLFGYMQMAILNKPQNLKSFIEYDCYPASELMYQGKVNKDIKELYASFYSEIPTLQVKSTNEKCHIGFVVTSGHEGVFLKCMKGILNNIDATQFKVSVVCSFPNGNKIIAPHISNLAIEFIVLPNDFTKAQQAIVDAKVDVLHYWEIGTDSTNYFLALTKPAPIQVTSWGWPGTSGLKTVDYFISQQNLEPNKGQEHYTEKLVLFDKMPVYYYRPPVPKNPKPLPSYGLPEDKHLYVCQQNLRKVHPDFDLFIKEILQKDKDGLVLFIKDKMEAITQKLQNRLSAVLGSLYSRVIFLERMNEEDYLGLLSQCKVALDTIYYGGGANTVYDAVEASIPLITLEGKHHSARFASATFKQMGVTDTITKNLSDYVDTAISIATDDEKRRVLIGKLKDNSSKLFEDLSAVKELESFFLTKVSMK